MKQFAICLICLIQLMSSQLFGQNTADYYLEKGKTFFKKDQFDSAIVVYNKGIKVGKNHFSQSEIASLHLELGNTYKITSLYSKALQEYQKANRIYQKTEDSEGKGKFYIALIEYYRANLKYSKAKVYIGLTQRLIDKKMLSKRLEAEYYSRCAAIETEGFAELDRSIAYSNKVLFIANALNDHELRGIAYNELGYVFENKNDQLKGIQYYKLALSSFELDSNHIGMANVLMNLGRIHTRFVKYNKAIHYLIEALEICNEYNISSLKSVIYYNLSLLYRDIKDFEKAYIYIGLYFEENAIQTKRKNDLKIAELDAKFDLEKQQILNKETLKRAFLAEKQTIEERKQVNYWILISLTLVFLVIVIAILGYRLRVSNRQLQNSNDELLNSINQKNALFKELHHRVKNNLTVLKSILFLHSKSSKDKKIVKVLQDCQSRIDSMAIVHQNLYDVEDSSRVEIDKFLNELISQLEESMLPENEKINVYLPVSHVVLDVTKAVFLGIIFNELVTNSIKYASSLERKLRIGIVIKEVGDELIIKYWDNGDGFSSDKLESDKGGFGFKLIQLMVKQLSSDLKYYHRDGKSTFKFTVLR